MRLTNLHRRVMRYHGQPADLVSVLERLTIHEVLEARAQLRAMGVTGITPYQQASGPCREDQLSLDRMMRANRAPRAADVELGDTTATDPEGW